MVVKSVCPLPPEQESRQQSFLSTPLYSGLIFTDHMCLLILTVVFVLSFKKI